VLDSGGNIGYGRANNAALLGRSGRYYAVLNSDLILQPGALDNLVAYLDSHPEVGAAGGALLNPDASTVSLPWNEWRPSGPQTNWAVGELTLASVVWEQSFLARLIPRSRLFGDYFRVYWHRQADAIVPQACGAFLIVRAALYNNLGGFDPRIFMYCEDTDLCRRIRDAGLSVAYVAGAASIHVHGQSSKGALRARMVYEHNRSRCYYLAKHHGMATAQAARTTMVLGAAARVLMRALLAALRPARAAEYAAESSAYASVMVKTALMRIPPLLPRRQTSAPP